MKRPRIATLDRWADTPFGVFGTLIFQTTVEYKFYTVEKRWRDNKKSVSCIPKGLYPLSLTRHQDKYECLAVEDVPGCSAIQIHIANVADELEGCIAPGNRLSYYKGRWSVARSGDAMRQIVQIYHLLRERPNDRLVYLHVKGV